VRAGDLSAVRVRRNRGECRRTAAVFGVAGSRSRTRGLRLSASACVSALDPDAPQGRKGEAGGTREGTEGGR
jgi:hypothetical protein